MIKSVGYYCPLFSFEMGSYVAQAGLGLAKVAEDDLEHLFFWLIPPRQWITGVYRHAQLQILFILFFGGVYSLLCG